MTDVDRVRQWMKDGMTFEEACRKMREWYKWYMALLRQKVR